MDVSTELPTPDFERIDPLVDAHRWDELVRQHPGASIFHSSAWIRVLSETYHYQPFYYALHTASRKGPSLLTLAEVSSWLTGRRGISLPFTDACPILSFDEKSFEYLWNHAVGLGKQRRWQTVEVRGIPDVIPSPRSLEFYSHSLLVNRGLPELFASFDTSVRRAIRKAEKSNVQVAIERSAEALSAYYELHCLTRKKHGLPPQPFGFFESIHRHIIQIGLGFIALATFSDAPVAGAVFFKYGTRGLYKFGASDPAADSLRPSNLVMWKGIQELNRGGVENLNFGRTSLHNAGLRRYKINWGSCETKCSYIKWDVRTGRFMTDRDRSTGNLNTIFRHCPSFAAGFLGRFLYRHIA